MLFNEIDNFMEVYLYNNMIFRALCFLSARHQWLAARQGLSSPRLAEGC